MDNIATGKLIRDARKRKNLTQKELGDLIHVADETVSAWETGKSMPKDEIKLWLCQALDLLPGELLVGKRMETGSARREMLAFMKKENGDIVRRIKDGIEEEFNLNDYQLVTLDREGNLTDVWIPYSERDNYTQEEIFAMQDKSPFRK